MIIAKYGYIYIFLNNYSIKPYIDIEIKKDFISSYRLGDLVFLSIEQDLMTDIILNKPKSIGAQYILAMQNPINWLIGKQYKSQDYVNKRLEVIYDIIINYINKNKHFLPDDIENSTVIHLRLGDVIAGTSEHELTKIPLQSNEIKSLLDNYNNINTNNKNNKIYIIGRPFYCRETSKNYEECNIKSNEYLEEVKNLLNATHISNEDADIDLITGIQAKLFFQGRGYYSLLIKKIRDKLNRPTVEIPSHI